MLETIARILGRTIDSLILVNSACIYCNRPLRPAPTFGGCAVRRGARISPKNSLSRPFLFNRTINLSTLHDSRMGHVHDVLTFAFLDFTHKVGDMGPLDAENRALWQDAMKKLPACDCRRDICWAQAVGYTHCLVVIIRD